VETKILEIPAIKSLSLVCTIDYHFSKKKKKYESEEFQIS
jgi:hypothetical protein